MAFGERWLDSLWPFVRSCLPPAPANVLELGCGPAGGFVPRLLASGYGAAGIDRDAPAETGYHRVDFEQFEPSQPADAIIASRSLHHVGDLGDVLDRVAETLAPGGALVVVEWEWERFDEATARWCFARLGEAAADDPHWLHRRRTGWAESGETWDAYFRGWADGHGLHRGERILAELDERFERALCSHGPYFFAELGIPEADEQAAIDAGEVRATGVRYLGTRT
jgi:SAM-dependent methyltransferase